jgi:GT2 family glycosyltransferase
MERLIQYMNPNGYPVQLVGPDRKAIVVPAHQKIILSEWFVERYVPKYLVVVKAVDGNERPIAKIERAMIGKGRLAKPTGNIPVAPTPGMAALIPQVLPDRPRPSPGPVPPKQDAPKSTTGRLDQAIRRRNAAILDAKMPQGGPQPLPTPTKIETRPSVNLPTRRDRHRPEQRRPIGHIQSADTSRTFASLYHADRWGISNGVGIGILSYNRLASLQRLIGSIRSNTDMDRVTVFVSDESTDPAVGEWLKSQQDLVVLTGQTRLGVAGNSNRLLRCLNRFRYCFLLNDDVEVLNRGWTDFYTQAQHNTGYHHFCYRQTGLLGATCGDISQVGQFKIGTITEKPHGAVMFFTNEAFRRVGYFDEGFGLYGMEHVDWSNRVGLSGIQPRGYHDVIGSDKFFKIHSEPSAVEDKSILLVAKQRFAALSADAGRVFVTTTDMTAVPRISVVIPIRNTERDGAIEAVINGVRAQLFPEIEIIVVEQDSEVRTAIDKFRPCMYHLAQSEKPGQAFTKALAFNIGLAKASYPDVILHDADMLAPRSYTQRVYNLLQDYEGVHVGKTVLYLTKSASSIVVDQGVINPGSECDRVVDYFEGGSLACRKWVYAAIGGFNEAYEGYGVEDCDFFERLKFCTKFHDERSVTLIHLWHGRTPGWEAHHERNKQIKAEINSKFNIRDRVANANLDDVAGLRSYSITLAKQYKSKYGQA